MIIQELLIKIYVLASAIRKYIESEQTYTPNQRCLCLFRIRYIRYCAMNGQAKIRMASLGEIPKTDHLDAFLDETWNNSTS